jgi:hypothetical protein
MNSGRDAVVGPQRYNVVGNERFPGVALVATEYELEPMGSLESKSDGGVHTVNREEKVENPCPGPQSR